MKRWQTYSLIAFFCAISLVLHIYNKQFPCFYIDEASFGYNAFSISQTARDEYGQFLPLRFNAFGEGKSPLLAYILVPFIALFGLNDVTVRLPILLVAIALIPLVYITTKELTRKNEIAIITAFLVAISPWIHTISRMAHEAILVVFFSALLFYLALLYKKSQTLFLVFCISIVTIMTLLSHNTGKIVPIMVILWLFYTLYISKISFKIKLLHIALCIIPLLFFLVIELQHPSSRVKNLFFLTSKGFALTIEDKLNNGGSRLIYNKAVYGGFVFLSQYITYFNPLFLVLHGDETPRFGGNKLGLITIIEYLFVLVGVVMAYKHHRKIFWYLIIFLLLAPVPAALSWQLNSSTRSIVAVVPYLIFASIGMYHAVQYAKKSWRTSILLIILLLVSVLYVQTWKTYFTTYMQDPLTQQEFNCGYNEVFTILKPYINDNKRIYFSRKWGQPYIYALYNMQYSPTKYFPQAKLTAPDEYGFGQIEKLDNIIFSLPSELPKNEETILVGTIKEIEKYNNITIIKTVYSYGTPMFVVAKHHYYESN
jgi:4-amino-4-deoxy-L-arabinose transferase-like glycosyltransferase